jgi:CheY-like chemotaxis protein
MVAEFAVRRVAVVDDDPSQAGVMSELVRDAGYEPIIIPHGPPYEHASELVGKVVATADAAICDHRLRPRGFALFDGAEVVAGLVDLHVPSLLVTQYIDIDADVSIRRWRHRVPVLLSRDEADPERIVQGLGECMREIHGELLSGRRPWRSLIRVDAISQESGEEVVDAHIPSWNPHEAVRFPLALMPESLRSDLEAGVCLFAKVNIGAERAEDLYFFDFEPAPKPEREDEILA